MADSSYEDSMVRYFAEVLSTKSDMPIWAATEAVSECIRDELKTAGERGLWAINIPMGRMMVGKQAPPTAEISKYILEVRAVETDRWLRNGVTEQDIITWWDFGGIVHGAYVAFDNMFNGAQVIDAMQHNDNCESVEELFDFGQLSLRKRFPLYGPANSDDGTEDGRLPHELRARVESWTLRARREQPATLFSAIQDFSSYNALCRAMVRRGEL